MCEVSYMRHRLSTNEIATLKRLGQTIRLARLHRNLSQDEMAERTGLSRSSIVALEAGHPGVGIGHLTKALTVFGDTDYLAKLSELMASDPIGDEMALVEGRQRARVKGGNVANF